mmetsp:Transcript_148935/g.260238  ORF Transcript_148935/g.260238 Transcript_148935/m.260238 type:complete len:345 (-) Transcript_148935:116-1150(-)
MRANSCCSWFSVDESPPPMAAAPAPGATGGGTELAPAAEANGSGSEARVGGIWKCHWPAPMPPSGLPSTPCRGPAAKGAITGGGICPAGTPGGLPSKYPIGWAVGGGGNGSAEGGGCPCGPSVWGHGSPWWDALVGGGRSCAGAGGGSRACAGAPAGCWRPWGWYCICSVSCMRSGRRACRALVIVETVGGEAGVVKGSGTAAGKYVCVCCLRCCWYCSICAVSKSLDMRSAAVVVSAAVGAGGWATPKVPAKTGSSGGTVLTAEAEAGAVLGTEATGVGPALVSAGPVRGGRGTLAEGAVETRRLCGGWSCACWAAAISATSKLFIFRVPPPSSLAFLPNLGT